MRASARCWCFLLLFVFLVSGAWAQNCPAPTASAPASSQASSNFFTPQQELALGDIIAESAGNAYHLVQDDTLNDYVQSLGNRLLKFAPTEIPVTFQLIDVPMVNAFAMPGGRIYVTRKLVAFARSEDELAGILGHELGHVIWRDGSARVSGVLRSVLGVQSVGDRQDIYEKFNQLLDNTRNKRVPPNRTREEREQLAADQMALYLLARAGYEPKAFVDILGRLVETSGDTGTWISDLFGMTTPDTKRLREVGRGQAALSVECKAAREANSGPQFPAWQARVIGYSASKGTESLRGVLAKRQLTPTLRPDISVLRFSPDGTYILAQDETSIYLMTREPFAFKFRIDAPEAFPAQFSPDSKSVVFYDAKLHAEKWSIPEQKATWKREVLVPEGCRQAVLSSNGEILACYGIEPDLSLISTSTSRAGFEKKGFYTRYTLLSMQFSPDCRYFVAAAGSENIAVDTSTMKLVSMSGAVKNVLHHEFTFCGSDRIAGMKGWMVTEKAALVRFPSGEVLRDDLTFGDASLECSTSGEYVLLRPIRDWAVGAFSFAQNKVVAASRTTAMDFFGAQVVDEMVNGEIGLHPPTSKQPLQTVKLPQGMLGRVRALDVSPDLKVIALSQQRRGGVWNTETGQRLFHVLGFKGAWVGNDDAVYVDFAAFGKIKRSIARLDLKTSSISDRPVVEGPPDTQDKGKKGKGTTTIAQGESSESPRLDSPKQWNVLQSGPYVLTLKFMKEGKPESGTLLVVSEVGSGKELWNRQFKKEPPLIYVNSRDETMTLNWRVEASAAKDEIKADADLNARFNRLQDQFGTYLLEVLNSRNGSSRGRLLVETGKGSLDIVGAWCAGDWVLIRDNKNRIVLYSLSSGEQKAKLFGHDAVLSTAGGLLAIENGEGRVSTYSLADLQKRDDYVFPVQVAGMAFSADGSRLLVLSQDQTVYWLDMKNSGSRLASKQQ